MTRFPTYGLLGAACLLAALALILVFGSTVAGCGSAGSLLARQQPRPEPLAPELPAPEVVVRPVGPPVPLTPTIEENDARIGRPHGRPLIAQRLRP